MNGALGDRGDGVETKPVCRLSNEAKYKKQLSTQCRACVTITIPKYVNNCLSTNPTKVGRKTLRN